MEPLSDQSAGKPPCEAAATLTPKLDPLQFFRTEQQATTLDLVEGGC
jgi:hypothetical protein